MTPVKTIILDIDGTLIEHKGTLSRATSEHNPNDEPLKDTIKNYANYMGRMVSGGLLKFV